MISARCLLPALLLLHQVAGHLLPVPKEHDGGGQDTRGQNGSGLDCGGLNGGGKEGGGQDGGCQDGGVLGFLRQSPSIL